MAKTTAAVTILAATSGAAGTSKASPGVTGGWIDVRAYYGGELGYSFTNGSASPGQPGTIQFQTSPDNGTTVYDYQSVSGTDTVASSVNSGSIALGKAMYIRAICYGNTTNAVTFAATLQAVVSL